jgi:hypothetical protein
VFPLENLLQIHPDAYTIGTNLELLGCGGRRPAYICLRQSQSKYDILSSFMVVLIDCLFVLGETLKYARL